ncbi:uncharacterized protein LOC117789462 [Drosophila innubila]|uniref:uncharacterized protein LOC117789462 n=1 Tax=Drosophila innubila TaxID=198719 RepID=UPI00148B9BF9|nr:uncharacterized protein LOC117789462 [Drosophila innubila]
MRYESLVLIFIVSIVLMVSAKSSHYQKKFRSGLCAGGNPSFCKINLKSTNMASKAADEAKAAKEAQTCAGEEASHRAMDQLADKAEHAARAAEAALKGKKQLLDRMLSTRNGTDEVIEEIKNAMCISRSNIQAVARVTSDFKQTLEQLQCWHDEAQANLVSLREIAANIRKDVKEKQKVLMESQQRVNNLKKCLMEATEDLDRTEKIAEQAESAAQEAKERINAVKDAFEKIKRLRKKDARSLRWILKRLVKK